MEKQETICDHVHKGTVGLYLIK